ncbi:MAG: YciE/YciF ferroxidase family protein [Solirubrobacteraceae bacterium]
MAPKTKDLNERDSKLVQWLNEAHAKEAELEADLTAHIGLTQKASYKKRLQQHLKETREHKRAVARRIKQLGGQASAGPSIPGVPDAVGGVAGKTVAAVKGQVGVARALVTEQAETHVRNVQEELREEHVEIALYLRVETFATEVGDRETATLAKRIRREEERMAKYLTAELPRLVKDVVRSEVPRDQRGSVTRSRRGATRSRASTSRTTTSRTSASRSGGTSRSASSRGAGSTRSTASSRSASSRGTAATRSTSRSGASRTGSRSRSARSTTAA